MSIKFASAPFCLASQQARTATLAARDRRGTGRGDIGSDASLSTYATILPATGLND